MLISFPDHYCRHRFSAHQIDLDIRADTPRFGKIFESLFGEYFPLIPSAPADTVDAFSIVAKSVKSASELPSAGAEFTQAWQCTPEGGLEITALCDQSRRILLLEDRAIMQYDLVAQTATVTAVDTAWGSVGFHCLVPFLTELLANQDSFLLHSAANRLPDSDKAVLLFGHSGAGKTTASLALGYGGLDVVCDDACFLSLVDDDFELWPLPRESHVHIETIELLPQMTDVPRRASSVSDEFNIDHRDLPCCDPHQRYRAAAVILLEPRNAEAHLLQPLPAIEALPELLCRVLRVVEPIASGPSGRMFQTLSRLCGSRPCFSLSVGPDLNTLAPTLLQALEGLPISP